jgi:hypothetical protein
VPVPAPIPPLDVPRRPERLTDRLNLKLGELRASGLEILWISASTEELVALLREGGEHAIMLDPDPSRDVAWYGRHEIRPSIEPNVRIFVDSDDDGMSCHIV